MQLQAYPELFNKALLMNAGFHEYSQHFEADCVVFHDVDMIPEDYRNFYTCHNSPRHLGAYVNKYHYRRVITNPRVQPTCPQWNPMGSYLLILRWS